MFGTVRNGGLYSESEYVGKTIAEATTYAESGGFIVRITETDGQSIMVDALDVKSNRLNFRVKNNIVIGVYGG